MKEKLRAALADASARLEPALVFLRAHRFWAECALVTVLGMVAAFSFGWAALGRARAVEARTADLARVEGSFDRWEAELQPPTPQESVTWRASTAALRALGAEATRPLALARLVAQRAEEVGIGDVSIRLLPTDSVTAFEPVELAGWRVEPAGEGLLVEFHGQVGDVVALLGSLPPQAAVGSVQLAPEEGALRARLVLLARQIVPLE